MMEEARMEWRRETMLENEINSKNREIPSSSSSSEQNIDTRNSFGLIIGLTGKLPGEIASSPQNSDLVSPMSSVVNGPVKPLSASKQTLGVSSSTSETADGSEED